MPAPDNTANTVTNNPEQVQPRQEQPVRELTQTDHLNKKLLTSLFKSLDESGEESLSKMMEPEDTSDKPTEDEWAE